MGLPVGSVGVCLQMGVNPNLTTMICGALIGREVVVDVLKAAADVLKAISGKGD